VATEYETLLRETITTNAATNSALVKLADALDQAATQAESRRTEISTQQTAELILVKQQLAQVAAELQRQTAAVEARTELYKTIAESLKSRWFMLLVGISAGLGLAGGRQLLNATISAVVPESGVGP
tara:strand:+ start:142 stop:522 length:381 start_codon:yes stop_codon:yes gene_type:complete